MQKQKAICQSHCSCASTAAVGHLAFAEAKGYLSVISESDKNLVAAAAWLGATGARHRSGEAVWQIPIAHIGNVAI